MLKGIKRVIQKKKNYIIQLETMTAVIIIMINILPIIINGLDSLPLTHSHKLDSPLVSGRGRTQHTGSVLILIHLLTSQSLTVRSGAQL